MATLTELIAERDELKSRVSAIDAEHAGERFPDEVREEWNRLNGEIDEYDARIKELELRQERVAALGQKPENREELTFQTARPGATRGENIYDLSTVRRSYDDPTVEGRELRDRAMRAVEGAQFPHPHAVREEAQDHVSRMLDAIDTIDGQLARRILVTGSPAYRRAFGKYIAGQYLANDEQRALSLTTSGGGHAVPFVLDPTIIPTSNLAVNPFRAISRVEQIMVDEWRGVSSAGITAAYAAEVTEAGDNAPQTAQPTVSTEKAQAFIPFSIEIGMDWAGLQVEMARLLQDSKDELEATKFAVGSGTNEPQGVITGATATVTSSTGGSFLAVDLYTLEANVPPRFRPRASIVMNRAIAQKIRQFDTAGGAQLWLDNLRVGLDNQVPTPGNYGARVLGYGAYEASAMASTVTTGSKVIIMGDFSHYLIADRVGLSIELIPHMFATANNRPSGQRGLYAYWRNGAGVLATNAFRILQL
jgi:HK97 family phage major capsid protein